MERRDHSYHKESQYTPETPRPVDLQSLRKIYKGSGNPLLDIYQNHTTPPVDPFGKRNATPAEVAAALKIIK